VTGGKKREGQTEQSIEQIVPWSGEKQTGSSTGTASVAPYTSLFYPLPSQPNLYLPTVPLCHRTPAPAPAPALSPNNSSQQPFPCYPIRRLRAGPCALVLCGVVWFSPYSITTNITTEVPPRYSWKTDQTLPNPSHPSIISSKLITVNCLPPPSVRKGIQKSTPLHIQSRYHYRLPTVTPSTIDISLSTTPTIIHLPCLRHIPQNLTRRREESSKKKSN